MRLFRLLAYLLFGSCFILAGCRDDFEPEISPSDFKRPEHEKLGKILLKDLLDQEEIIILERSLLYDSTIVPYTQSIYDQISAYILSDPSVPSNERWSEASNWKVYILNSELPNAFILPSGDLFISTALLLSLESKYELYYIMAFEAMLLEHRFLINALFEHYNTNTIYEWTKGRYLYEGNSIKDLGHTIRALEFEPSQVQTIDSLTTVLLCESTLVDPKGIIPVIDNLRGRAESWLEYRPSYLNRINYISEELPKVTGACGNLTSDGSYTKNVLDVLD